MPLMTHTCMAMIHANVCIVIRFSFRSLSANKFCEFNFSVVYYGKSCGFLKIQPGSHRLRKTFNHSSEPNFDSEPSSHIIAQIMAISTLNCAIIS